LPFDEQTLTAHITALLRRTKWAQHLAQTEALSVGAIYLCPDTHTVKVSDRPIELSPLDYRLLYYLMQRANCAVSKAELRRALWADQREHSGNFIEVAIRRLRNKIEENPSSPKYLVTQYGTGYKLIHS
jgi:DNA-binding response OmpR family regulator